MAIINLLLLHFKSKHSRTHALDSSSEKLHCTKLSASQRKALFSPFPVFFRNTGYIWNAKLSVLISDSHTDGLDIGAEDKYLSADFGLPFLEMELEFFPKTLSDSFL